MSSAYIHLGVHAHLHSHGTCWQSLDIAYQTIASEVIKKPMTIESTIVMVVSKEFLSNYMLKSLQFVMGASRECNFGGFHGHSPH